MQIVLHALVTASTTWTGGALISIIIKEEKISLTFGYNTSTTIGPFLRQILQKLNNSPYKAGDPIRKISRRILSTLSNVIHF
jgi:hypothetical protein